MQRIRLNRRILIISCIILALSIAVDLVTKVVFKNLYEENGKTVIIKNFFYFTYTQNTGSAFSFLADKAWAQTFFKIITVFALAIFMLFWIYSNNKNYTLLAVGLSLIIGGTIGNFIDRVAFDYVRDFIGMTFFGWNFPIFNVADTCLTFGVILFVAHYLFLDADAIFKKSKTEDINENKEETNQEDEVSGN